MPYPPKKLENLRLCYEGGRGGDVGEGREEKGTLNGTLIIRVVGYDM